MKIKAVDHEKDLGVIAFNDLKTKIQCREAARRANWILVTLWLFRTFGCFTNCTIERLPVLSESASAGEVALQPTPNVVAAHLPLATLAPLTRYYPIYDCSIESVVSRFRISAFEVCVV